MHQQDQFYQTFTLRVVKTLLEAIKVSKNGFHEKNKILIKTSQKPKLEDFAILKGPELCVY